MDVNTALWIAGASLFPTIGWAIHMSVMAMKSKEDTTKILSILEDPDKHGFGTEATNRIIEDNTRAMQALVHYIKWLVKDQTGGDPPPPL
jgi:hypothetical protein